ncbi:uncharacterized protein KQ657_003690 [Scheffersomyces spartinae]|uniref:NADH dehydrogenase [ubiquinone] iron-sulfur protein 4, mitochondrial n=1 Tax=Scheffersomyces spartinae TaxID=45513 RepID=A0A9P8AJU7_9ASCO|nr:uncharacterized protein KQ657_003690 [Scheffersomyces spartinae]KAG7195166.1 hypothetical protein KQ657_003690 [Scheffersomyces spartinae]
MLSRTILRYSGVRAFSCTTAVRQSLPTNVNVVDEKTVANELTSGAHNGLSTTRTCRIFQEAKPATQSGQHNGSVWKIDWDVLGSGNRWENDLMGYQSTSDYMQATQIKFDTKEAAIRFAEGQGYGYYVQEPKKRHFRQKDYSINFLHSKGPLKHIRTK